jgi:hypothetical protein
MFYLNNEFKFKASPQGLKKYSLSPANCLSEGDSRSEFLQASVFAYFFCQKSKQKRIN